MSVKQDNKSSFKNAFLGLNNKVEKPKKKEEEFIIVTKPHKIINIKAKMVKWLLIDMGDNMILFDFILISFENMLNTLSEFKISTTRKEFFTRYVNWIYKNTLTKKPRIKQIVFLYY